METRSLFLLLKMKQNTYFAKMSDKTLTFTINVGHNQRVVTRHPPMNAAIAIAKHFKVNHWQVTRVEEWAKAFFAVVKELGARFVSKKVAKVEPQIPNFIVNRIKGAIASIKEGNRQLLIGRGMDVQFNGEGRYEFDSWHNCVKGLFHGAKLSIDQFLELAPKNGIDGLAVLTSLGYEEPLNLSVSAKEWQ